MTENPVARFQEWFREAEQAGVEVPEAMALATADADGAPSARMVLLKGADEDGFVFYSGYVSRKAGELDQNPRAALVFYWRPLGKQVRVEGTVDRVSEAESAEYFATRPRGSQLAAWASQQSSPLASRQELERRYAELEREYEGREVPLPPHWGGYRLRPETIEFWEHRENRLHDRIRYTRAREGWKVERLAP
ncbi:MAG: pyridoxamine 5'-phosphate oxidase [Actinobacteria bacterium]|nr:MAG: pyridoxamine 5'-phosphate oxidase [Actinomycetota bacterium]